MESSTSLRYAIVGAGPMGLAAAVHLLDAGHQVDIYERDDRIGGMSAAFDFDGLSIERYYHFVCKTDDPPFALLDRYGLGDRLKWTDTRMGYYYDGKLYKWGSPFALLAFPHLGPIDKLRYALHVMYTKGIQDWSALDKEEAGAWIRRWIGDKAYDVMWREAFRLKFFEYKDKFDHHHVPGFDFQVDQAHAGIAGPMEIFFSLYFTMTGLHALHMVIGFGLMSVITWMAYRNRFSPQWYTPVEMSGLYWHFVDIVWIFLFPLLYLVDRTQ